MGYETDDKKEYRKNKSKMEQKDISADDEVKKQLLIELRELRIENERLKERMIQIKELTSI